MRKSTINQLNILYEKITELLEDEKAYFDIKNPYMNELFRYVNHTKIDMYLYHPIHRSQMVVASAHLQP